MSAAAEMPAAAGKSEQQDNKGKQDSLTCNRNSASSIKVSIELWLQP